MSSLEARFAGEIIAFELGAQSVISKYILCGDIANSYFSIEFSCIYSQWRGLKPYLEIQFNQKGDIFYSC